MIAHHAVKPVKFLNHPILPLSKTFMSAFFALASARLARLPISVEQIHAEHAEQ